ncbi:MAG: NAD(P)/FAD-dependent oxidoreductase [Deltaproteobacteria bacterium]|nr:NAD(P)/FAD-dependent oxidoreductase [Deltaproteobacteria bacterium]
MVGGGFGGLEAAKHLDALPVRVTLVDARNHHLFQPLLYQVATAGLSPSDIAIPIRSVLRKRRRVRTLLDRVSRIDLEGREVHLENGPALRYDYLILAAGARTNYFGNDRWAEHALGLKSVEDALAIRRRVLLSYEEAERGLEPDELRRKLTFVVIGGGPTGVEVAGAIAELARRVLAADYHNIDPNASRVVLVEAAPQILGGFDPALSEAARRDLEKLGVEVRTGAPVRDITAEGVHLDGELLRAGVVVWGAGVSASPLADTLGVPQDRAGRVIVNRDCSIPGHPEAWAIGDIARFDREDGQPLPGVSPVAMQQARAVARNVGRRMAGQQTEPFEYYDKGMMATIGRTHAVAQSHGVKMTGMLAWLAWLFIHLWYLVGFKNRVFVLLNWIWSYVMFRRGARLITGEQPAGRGA